MTYLSVFALIAYLRVMMMRYALSEYLIYNPSNVDSNVSLFMGFLGMFSSVAYCS